MSAYGNWGGPNRLLEAYVEWRDDRLEKVELGLIEADSKADFPEFLYGPVRTALWGGYQKITPQYRRYARIENAPDFRERRLKGLNALRGIGYVGDHGEYPGMKRTERPAASLVVDTYGAVYAITRQAIRNDDTGELLNRNPGEMGFAMGNFVAETIVALIESNPTAPDGAPMFQAAGGGQRGNLVTSALSEDSMADAITFMEQQRDDDGFRIMVKVGSLIVQNVRNELIAKRILNSALTGAETNYTGGTAGVGTTLFDKGTMNALSGIIPGDAVIREPFFTDPNDWYVFADPEVLPAFALGFLDGNEQPFVGLKDPEVRNALGPGVDPYTYELDSIDFKVRHDFGCAPVDPRGAYKASVA